MLINGGTPLSPVPETNAGLHGAGMEQGWRGTTCFEHAVNPKQSLSRGSGQPNSPLMARRLMY